MTHPDTRDEGAAAKHAPGPWTAESVKPGEIYILDASGNTAIARVMAGRPDGKANAARIVQCVNAHDELVAASEIAGNVLFLLKDEVKALSLRAENVREKLRAAIAIAKATGSAQ